MARDVIGSEVMEEAEHWDDRRHSNVNDESSKSSVKGQGEG